MAEASRRRHAAGIGVPPIRLSDGGAAAGLAWRTAKTGANRLSAARTTGRVEAEKVPVLRTPDDHERILSVLLEIP